MQRQTDHGHFSQPLFDGTAQELFGILHIAPPMVRAGLFTVDMVSPTKRQAGNRMEWSREPGVLRGNCPRGNAVRKRTLKEATAAILSLLRRHGPSFRRGKRPDGVLSAEMDTGRSEEARAW